MTSSRVHPLRPSRVAGWAAIASIVAAVSWAPAIAHEPTTVLAQEQAPATTVAPSQLSSYVTDASGVLSGQEIAEMEQAIQQFMMDHQKALLIVYMPSFGPYSPQAWTEEAVYANGGGNTAVLAIATDDRIFDVYADTRDVFWSESEVEDIYEAAYDQLVSSDWAAAGMAAVDAAASSGEISSESLAWLGVGGVAAVAAGGGIWAASRRRSKQASEESLATARALDPSDTSSIEQLPIDTLAQRSEEIIVSTDDSVRRAREELNIAIAEFGPEQTRPFNKALNEANSALQRAYRTQADLNDAIPETEPQQRAMYTDIISSAGTAEQALNAQAEKFQEMRNLLINASPRLDELTQQTVDLRARIEPAKLTMEQLTEDYATEVLSSIEDNVPMALVAVDEAEKQIAAGRDVLQKPAGQQGALIPAIREAEHMIELADSLLAGVEHADTNISAAKANLSALITEIQEEIEEAGQLRQHGTTTGAQADWDSLARVVNEARDALRTAETTAQRDPLGTYTTLMNVDTLLDEQLDAVRDTTASQDRLLAMLDQQLQATQASMQAAEDLIATRGRVIDAQARTLLAQAQQLHAHSLQIRTKNTRDAIGYARRAGQIAERALGRAQADIRAYQNRVHAQQGSSSMSNMITGMVLGQMLSGGGGGGFGGGFGGSGGGGGGGFSGGGGTHRGGSF